MHNEVDLVCSDRPRKEELEIEKTVRQNSVADNSQRQSKESSKVKVHASK